MLTELYDSQSGVLENQIYLKNYDVNIENDIMYIIKITHLNYLKSKETSMES